VMLKESVNVVDKKTVSGLMALTAFLSLMAGGYVLSTPTYLCQDTQQICLGRLSSTGKTCYYTTSLGTQSSKSCSSLWAVYNNTATTSDSSKVTIYRNGVYWACPNPNPVSWRDTECKSKLGIKSLGELI
jgi:hypothetical protein